MGKREELIETFKGVAVLFIVLPNAENRVELTQVTAEAAKEAGVKHVLGIGGPNSDNPRTLLEKQMQIVEQTLANLGPKYTILRLPWFMENFFGFKETIEKFSAFYGAIDPTQKFRLVCMDDVGLVAAIIMHSPDKHAGKKYFIVSDKKTYGDVEKAFSDALGKDVKYTQQSRAEASAGLAQMGLPEWQVEGLMRFIDDVNAGLENEGVAEKDFTEITGKQPTNVATWVQRYAAAFK